MDPVRIRNWALAVTACAAVAGPALVYGRRVIAQEAAAAARQQMEPATRELAEIKELLRRQEDREAFKVCMEYAHQDQPQEVRYQTCTRESNQRWAVWAWEDCEDQTPGKCGERPGD